MTPRTWITAGVVALLFLPVVFDDDGFPLSTYPMYSRTRPAEVSFVTAQGVDADGQRIELSLEIIGASDDPLIVAGELRAAIRDGRAADRCVDIASRAAAAGRTGLEVVEVVTERHDVIDATSDEASLISRDVHASCAGGDV